MRAFETTVQCLLVLGALSTTPTDAFARFEHHEGRGDFAAAEDRAREIPRDDASKLHTVLKHPEENRSDFDASSELRAHGPEIVTLEGRAHGIVHEDDVGAVHPESKTQKKSDTCSTRNFEGC